MNNPDPNRKAQTRMQLQIPPDLQALYANLAVIAHTNNEFFFDFAQLAPGLPKINVHSRLVMSPIHAKLLFRALEDNLKQYEEKYGPIDLPPTIAEQLFKNARSQAPDAPEEDSN
jgi:hypothetical protein